MMNGLCEIDTATLAQRARAAREAKQMSQTDVAVETGLPQTWISAVELQKIGMKLGEQITRAKTLAKVLDFAIPYVNKHPASAPDPKPEVADPPKPTFSLPVKAVVNQASPAMKALDAELEAIRICCEVLERLNDKHTSHRVLGYLRARYGLPKSYFENA